MSVQVASPPSRLRLIWLMRLLATGLRRNRLATAAGCGAFVVATLALLVCAGYLSRWSGRSRSGVAPQRVELVAFLRQDLPASARDTLASVLQRLPGVVGVRLLGSDEALSTMRRELGESAAVLDGVEEGFLPATLEVTLQSGASGKGRADAIAWRLRRMDGITDVDVLRSEEDQRVIRAEALSRQMGDLGLVLAILALVLSFCLAGLGLRRDPADARLLTGFGFTAAAVAAPGAALGALCGLAGGALATALAVIIGHWSESTWLNVAATRFAGDIPAALGVGVGPQALAMWGGGRGLMGSVAVVVAGGAVLGWWGARLSAREVDNIGASI